MTPVEHQQSVQHDCSRPGCKLKAECIPVLLVPSHPLSKNPKFQGCRSVLWLPLCRHHFTASHVREFLSGEVIAGMRGSIENDFRENESMPDWNRAKVEMAGKNTAEFRQYEAIYLNIRRGTPTDIAVKDQMGRSN